MLVAWGLCFGYIARIAVILSPLKLRSRFLSLSPRPWPTAVTVTGLVLVCCFAALKAELSVSLSHSTSRLPVLT